MKDFTAFELNETLLKSVARLGFTQPTEIQQKSIPVLLNNQDLIGQSKTGSGKTAAYLLPILSKLITSEGQMLVLVPTRELAIQVQETINSLLPQVNPQSRLKPVIIIGGAAMSPQVHLLRQNPKMIIATPGRLVDHLSHGSVRFDQLKYLVLDEADRMLDMGFYPQIKRILPKLPRQRQTALFSATFSKEILKLAKEIMKNPVEVTVGKKHSAPTSIDQQVIETQQKNKGDRLVDELNARQGSVLIFTRTKHKTDKLNRFLLEYGFNVGRIHGDRSLAQRKKAIDSFKSGEIRILVATDIAARGLDIAQVGHVINFDLPQSPEDYLHRVGRTGRAGASGHAVSFVTPEDKKMWQSILKYSQQSFRQL